MVALSQVPGYHMRESKAPDSDLELSRKDIGRDVASEYSRLSCNRCVPGSIPFYKQGSGFPKLKLTRMNETRRLMNAFIEMDLLRGTPACPIPFIESIEHCHGLGSLESFTELVSADTITGSVLRSAQTVFVQLNTAKAIWTQFPGNLVDFSSLLEWVKFNAPLFLVFEICEGFPATQTLDEYTDQWLKPLTISPGVYTMIYVHWQDTYWGNEAKNGIKLVRIHINPLTKEDMVDIVRKIEIQLCSNSAPVPMETLIRRSVNKLPGFVKEAPGEDIVAAYGRCLHSLTNGFVSATFQSIFFDDMRIWGRRIGISERVRRCVIAYPREVGEVYWCFKRKEYMDLTRIIGDSGGDFTMEYFAVKLGIGFGMDIRQTQLYIPPQTEALLDGFYLEFDDYVDSLRNRCSPIRDGVPLTNILIRYFEKVYSEDSVGQPFREFIPIDSIMYNETIRLDRFKRQHAYYGNTCKRIQTGDLVGLGGVVDKILRVSSTDHHAIVYPITTDEDMADFFLVTSTLVVGVIARGNKNYSTLIGSFEHILHEISESNKIMRGVVIILEFVLKSDGPNRLIKTRPKEKSFLLVKSGKGRLCDVIFANLATPQLRFEFFRHADPGTVKTIEDLISGNVIMIRDDHQSTFAV